MKKYRIAPEVREQIINRIKNEGITVAQASKDHGVSDVTIYKWLGSKADGPTYAEIAKLKKENKALFELVGEMTLKLSETQKKN
ncbi:MAG TPA: transposase [Candidatus Paceibacterota bacterium]